MSTQDPLRISNPAQSALSELIQTSQAAELTRAQVDDILHALGDHIGVSPFALDEDGTATLTIDGRIELSLAYPSGSPALLVAATINHAVGDQPAFLKTALQANMHRDLVRGGAFVMLPGAEPVLALAWHVLLADRDVERIDRELAEIAAFADFWRRELARAHESEAELLAIQAEKSPPGIMA